MPNEIWAAMLGALMGALVTYWLAMKVADKQFEHLRAISKIDAWHSAAHEFISVFAPDVVTLERNFEGDVMDFLRTAHARHTAAVAIFDRYLPPTSRAGFREAWQGHCYGSLEDGSSDLPEGAEMDHDDLLYLHYSGEMNIGSAGTPRRRAIARMNALLAYASEA